MVRALLVERLVLWRVTKDVGWVKLVRCGGWVAVTYFSPVVAESVKVVFVVCASPDGG